MNVLVLNGVDGKEPEFNVIIQKLLNAMKELAVVRTINLEDSDILPCQGCFGCWTKTPGTCVINDDAVKIAGEFVKSDLVVFLTPVRFGGFSSTLKKAVDRLIPNILPYFKKINGEIHHKPRYDKHPEIAAVGLLKEDDKQSKDIFSSLIKRISINMFSPLQRTFFLYENKSVEELDDAVNNICTEVGGLNAG